MLAHDGRARAWRELVGGGRRRRGCGAARGFAGIALLLLHNRRAIRLSQVLSILICLWALLAIIGYVYQAEQLYEIARYTGIALPTSVSLFVLGLGLLAARVDSGITSVISKANAGGLMARWLLLLVVVIPFLLGWVSVLGQRLGYFDLGFAVAFLVLSITFIFTFAVWQSTRKLSEVEK